MVEDISSSLFLPAVAQGALENVPFAEVCSEFAMSGDKLIDWIDFDILKNFNFFRFKKAASFLSL